MIAASDFAVANLASCLLLALLVGLVAGLIAYAILTVFSVAVDVRRFAAGVGLLVGLLVVLSCLY